MKKVTVTTAAGFNHKTMQFEPAKTYEVEIPEIEFDLITCQGIKFNEQSQKWENEGEPFEKRTQKGHGYEVGSVITSIAPGPHGIKFGFQSHSTVTNIVSE